MKKIFWMLGFLLVSVVAAQQISKEDYQSYQKDMAGRIEKDPGKVQWRESLYRAAILNEDFETASVQADALSSMQPQNEEYAMHRIRAAYFSQDFAKTKTLLDEYIQKFPESERVPELSGMKQNLESSAGLPPLRDPEILPLGKLEGKFNKLKRFYPLMQEGYAFAIDAKGPWIVDIRTGEKQKPFTLFKGWKDVKEYDSKMAQLSDLEIFHLDAKKSAPVAAFAASFGGEYYLFENRPASRTGESIIVNHFKNLEERNCDFPAISPWMDILVAACPSEKSGRKDSDLVFYKRSSTTGWFRISVDGLDAINTDKDERYPSFSEDGRFLYILSNGHAGYGGVDVITIPVLYKKEKNSGYSVSLGKPANVLKDINSFRDEIMPVRVFKNQPSLYYMREHPTGNELVHYALKHHGEPLSSVVNVAIDVTSSTGVPLQAEIQMLPLVSGDNRQYLGEFYKSSPLMRLHRGKSYSLRVRSAGHLYYYDEFTLREDQDFLNVEAKLVPLKPGSAITARALRFESGSAALAATSFAEIDIIKDLLLKNPSIGISIEGHTDNVGGYQQNIDLSYSRADNVRRSLIERGVPAERMRIRGWGSVKPVVPNTSEENRARNRRTEIIVIEPGKQKMMAILNVNNVTGDFTFNWMEDEIGNTLRTIISKKLGYNFVSEAAGETVRKSMIERAGRNPFTPGDFLETASLTGSDLVLAGSFEWHETNGERIVNLTLYVYDMAKKEIVIEDRITGPYDIMFFSALDEATYRIIARMLDY